MSDRQSNILRPPSIGGRATTCVEYFFLREVRCAHVPTLIDFSRRQQGWLTSTKLAKDGQAGKLRAKCRSPYSYK